MPPLSSCTPAKETGFRWEADALSRLAASGWKPNDAADLFYGFPMELVPRHHASERLYLLLSMSREFSCAACVLWTVRNNQVTVLDAFEAPWRLRDLYLGRSRASSNLPEPLPRFADDEARRAWLRTNVDGIERYFEIVPAQAKLLSERLRLPQRDRRALSKVSLHLEANELEKVRKLATERGITLSQMLREAVRAGLQGSGKLANAGV